MCIELGILVISSVREVDYNFFGMEYMVVGEKYYVCMLYIMSFYYML